jgi:hypothetical protein
MEGLLQCFSRQAIITAENGICRFLSLVTQWSYRLYLFILYPEPLTAIAHKPLTMRDLLAKLASRNPSLIRRNQPETLCPIASPSTCFHHTREYTVHLRRWGSRSDL